MKSFAEFWPYYLGEHQNPLCRQLHFVGTTIALGLLVSAFLVGDPRLGVAALLSGYAFAWVGHFVIEKNRPATFKHPIWSFIGDWKMWALMLSGRLDGELSRLGIGAKAA